MKRFVKSISIILVVLLAFSAYGHADLANVATTPANSDVEETEKVFETDTLTIKVPTSQVPFYYFWPTGDNSSTYRVQFDALYEAKDNNSNDEYDLGDDMVYGDSMFPLSTMVWEMSEIVEETSADETITHFNLTGTLSYDSFSVPTVVKFANHLTTSGGETSLKFDIIVNNYEWSQPSEDTLLIIAYKLQSTDPNYNDLPRFDEDGRVRFGQGFFDAVTTASNSTGEEVSEDVKVAVSAGIGSDYDSSSTDGQGRIYLSYTYFEGNLTHDPTIGLDDIADASDKLIEADGLTIKVPTAQVPFYFFWPTDNTDNSYRVQFDAMFEVYDENGNDAYDQGSETIVTESMVALAQMGWDMSDIVNTTEDGKKVIHFNLTGSTDDVASNPELGDLRIQFRNHITVDGDDSSLKFDIVVENYEWTNTSDNTMLVLAYKLQSNSSQYDSVEQDGESVQFGSGYFNSTSTASNSTGDEVANTVKSSLSTGDGSGTASTDSDARIYIAYTHFTGNLTHDPSIGLSSSDDTSTSETSSDTSSDEEVESSDDGSLPFFMLASVLAMIAIPVLRRRIR